MRVLIQSMRLAAIMRAVNRHRKRSRNSPPLISRESIWYGSDHKLTFESRCDSSVRSTRCNTSVFISVIGT